MNGFRSDVSALDLLQGWFVCVEAAKMHGRAKTWLRRAGLSARLPQEGRILGRVERAVEW